MFGSYAKGVANDNSDVDLFVDSDLRGLKFVGLMESVRRALHDKEVDIINAAHIDNGSKLLNEINQTGKVIYERWTKHR